MKTLKLEMQTHTVIVTQANSDSAILQPKRKSSMCFVKEEFRSVD